MTVPLAAVSVALFCPSRVSVLVTLMFSVHVPVTLMVSPPFALLMAACRLWPGQLTVIVAAAAGCVKSIRAADAHSLQADFMFLPPWDIVPPSGRDGGGSRNRTGVHGFAGRCMTTLPSRQGRQKREGPSEAPRDLPYLSLERETSLELATSTLARLRSTN